MVKGVKIVLGAALILIGAGAVIVTGLIYFPMWMMQSVRRD
jgi:hypothetical protein